MLTGLPCLVKYDVELSLRVPQSFLSSPQVDRRRPVEYIYPKMTPSFKWITKRNQYSYLSSICDEDRQYIETRAGYVPKA